jgi:hypothetical protein
MTEWLRCVIRWERLPDYTAQQTRKQDFFIQAAAVRSHIWLTIYVLHSAKCPVKMKRKIKIECDRILADTACYTIQGR